MASVFYFLSIALCVGHKIVCIISTPFSIFSLFSYFHIFHIFHFLFRARGKGGEKSKVSSLKFHNWHEPKTYQERVPVTISYQLDFLCISKVWSTCLDWWGEFRVKNGILSVGILFRCFFWFVDFDKKNWNFTILISFYMIKFKQQIINQSDTRIGDNNLSVELLSNIFRKLITRSTHYLLCENPMYLTWEYVH